MSLNEVIREVKTQYDLRTYVETVTGAMTVAGTNKWKACCPFHSEKTPSFTVDERTQRYYCYGCKRNGDIIAFVQEDKRLDFMDALKELAFERGIQFDRGGKSSGDDFKKRGAQQAITAETAKFFRQEFLAIADNPHHKAVQEITRRNLPLNVMKFGYAPARPQALYQHLLSKGFKHEDIVESGVCAVGDNGKVYDFWRERLMFIFGTVNGKPLGFSGKLLYESDRAGKYVNSRENMVFHKSEVFFNHKVASQASKDSHRVFVVEGQFDVAAMVNAGLMETVATSGTSLSPVQAKALLRMVNGGEITMVFDGDSAGRKATVSAFRTLPELHGSTKAVLMPEGMDPSDYQKEYSPEALVELVTKEAKPLYLVVAQLVKGKYDLSDPLAKNAYYQKMVSLATHITSATVMEAFVAQIGLHSGVPLATIRKDIKRASANQPVATPLPEVKIVHFEAEKTANEASYIHLMKEDPLHTAYGRLIAVATVYPSVFSSASIDSNLVPPVYRTVLNEVIGSTRIITQGMTYPALAEAIIRPRNLVTLEFMDEKDVPDYLNYLVSYVKKTKKDREEEAKQQRLIELLATSKADPLELLRAIVNNEDLSAYEEEVPEMFFENSDSEELEAPLESLEESGDTETALTDSRPLERKGEPIPSVLETDLYDSDSEQPFFGFGDVVDVSDYAPEPVDYHMEEDYPEFFELHLEVEPLESKESEETQPVDSSEPEGVASDNPWDYEPVDTPAPASDNPWEPLPSSSQQEEDKDDPWAPRLDLSLDEEDDELPW